MGCHGANNILHIFLSCPNIIKIKKKTYVLLNQRLAVQTLLAQMAWRVIYEQTWDPLPSHMPVPPSQVALLRATAHLGSCPYTPHCLPWQPPNPCHGGNGRHDGIPPNIQKSVLLTTELQCIRQK